MTAAGTDGTLAAPPQITFFAELRIAQSNFTAFEAEAAAMGCTRRSCVAGPPRHIQRSGGTHFLGRYDSDIEILQPNRTTRPAPSGSGLRSGQCPLGQSRLQLDRSMGRTRQTLDYH